MRIFSGVRNTPTHFAMFLFIATASLATASPGLAQDWKDEPHYVFLGVTTTSGYGYRMGVSNVVRFPGRESCNGKYAWTFIRDLGHEFSESVIERHGPDFAFHRSEIYTNGVDTLDFGIQAEYRDQVVPQFQSEARAEEARQAWLNRLGVQYTQIPLVELDPSSVCGPGTDVDKEEPAPEAANRPIRGGILLEGPGPSAEEVAAQQAKDRREAQIKEQMNKLGAHREAEIRRLAALRDAASRATPKCRESTVSASGNSGQNVQNRLLFQGWKTRQDALKQALGNNHLGSWCQRLTGNQAHGAVKESCKQDNGGRWECDVETNCSAKQVVCGGLQ